MVAIRGGFPLARAANAMILYGLRGLHTRWLRVDREARSCGVVRGCDDWLQAMQASGPRWSRHAIMVGKKTEAIFCLSFIILCWARHRRRAHPLT